MRVSDQRSSWSEFCLLYPYMGLFQCRGISKFELRWWFIFQWMLACNLLCLSTYTFILASGVTQHGTVGHFAKRLEQQHEHERIYFEKSVVKFPCWWFLCHRLLGYPESLGALTLNHSTTWILQPCWACCMKSSLKSNLTMPWMHVLILFKNRGKRGSEFHSVCLKNRFVDFSDINCERSTPSKWIIWVVSNWIELQLYATEDVLSCAVLSGELLQHGVDFAAMLSVLWRGRRRVKSSLTMTWTLSWRRKQQKARITASRLSYTYA